MELISDLNAKLLDQGLRKRRDIVRIAASDEIDVGHHLAAHHIGSDIEQIGADRGPAGHGSAVEDVGLHLHRLAQVLFVPVLDLARVEADDSGFDAGLSNAALGFSNFDCSKPSVARIITLVMSEVSVGSWLLQQCVGKALAAKLRGAAGR